jgi:hypothetical protein
MVRRTYKGRKNSRKSGRRTTKSRRNVSSRRQKRGGAGVRFGTGIGSNCHDPNQSIFNTNLLKLFPYKP